MKQLANGYVSNRVLKLNVGFLLAAGPGHSHDVAFDAPATRVSEDVDVSFIRGPLRLSRTKEGILVQGTLEVGLEDECARCLDPVQHVIDIDVEELYAYPDPNGSEYTLSDDGVLDLSPLVRDEALIADAQGTLCRPDCKGLCPECGANLNHDPTHNHDDNIDPRLAKLKELLNK
ncbi:MAG: YceD family protein [bacterium]|nr:YceD family protein [bacterium]